MYVYSCDVWMFDHHFPEHSIPLLACFYSFGAVCIILILYVGQLCPLLAKFGEAHGLSNFRTGGATVGCVRRQEQRGKICNKIKY